jgi:hypothetical protein
LVDLEVADLLLLVDLLWVVACPRLLNLVCQSGEESPADKSCDNNATVYFSENKNFPLNVSYKFNF